MILRTCTAVTCFGLACICLASAADTADRGMWAVASLGILAGLIWGVWGIHIIAWEDTDQ